MGRLCLVVFLVAACGGVQIPQHSGYKSDKSKPWKKAKTLKFDDKNEAKSEGDLSYVDFKRAAWFAIDVASPSEVDLGVEITPPGDGVNEDFDLGFEVLDPSYRVIKRSDLEEGDQQHELNKTAKLLDLQPGKYLVHLYLQGRLDSADYILHATLKPTGAAATASAGKSDFPTEVAFPSPLPMVPIADDTPKSYKPPVTTATVTHTTHHQPTPPTKPAEPPATTISAHILGLSVVSGGTQITIGAGTARNAKDGMHVKVPGIPDNGYVLAGCNERTCTAVVKATPDQVKGAGSVTITP